MSIQRVIISGGGTGGHIYPAIAIANALQEQNPTIEILFVGAEGKMEMEKVPKAGYQIIGLPIVGINRSNPLKNLLFPFKLASSFNKAMQIIKDFNPDIAIGVGGYASGPLLLAASLKNIPIFIQEQNSFAGITNKFLAKKAKKIFVAYPNMERFFPKEKINWLGNPVRKDLIQLDGKKEKAVDLFKLSANKPCLLVIGGSQGARSINKAIAENISKIASSNIQLIWQTGVGFEKEAKEIVNKHPNLEAYVSAFIYEMDLAYAAADLVCSRAGALSVSEICLAGKPSILVPFPAAAEDHQTENARSLEKEGAAILVKDSEASLKMVDEALKIMQQPENLQKIGFAAKKLGKPMASTEIAQQILQSIN
ncbi:undecaprenyldiphospho-muramoylpentapeptide beta-N-acetylglucosaminyltransferase [Sandaracinomonas limnophila]|uniref:undecaprenyldiphospho-muramoylpentapeptide beta-N-acetylglucosaminyltransferase n=1 Tax=Sandaracinomonas limnophila TaxID=1862386 RepID=UPI0026A9CB58